MTSPSWSQMLAWERRMGGREAGDGKVEDEVMGKGRVLDGEQEDGSTYPREL
jgi:hypothetical protein